MKIYLAAAFSLQEEAKKLSEELIALGIKVTSRWLEEKDNTKTVQERQQFLRETAFMDVSDVRAADMLVRLSDDLTGPTVKSKLATGARMFETGLAWAAGIPIVVVGGHQNVFDHLPNIIHVPDVSALKAFLSSRA